VPTNGDVDTEVGDDADGSAEGPDTDEGVDGSSPAQRECDAPGSTTPHPADGTGAGVVADAHPAISATVRNRSVAFIESVLAP
jgi:hypothetical protein